MRHAPQPRAMCWSARVGPLQPALPLVLLQLQAAAGQQAEALVGVAARMERLEKDIRDTGECIDLLFAVSARRQQCIPTSATPKQQLYVVKLDQCPPLPYVVHVQRSWWLRCRACPPSSLPCC